MRIYNPRADVAAVQAVPAAPVGDLRGARVVLLHNNKPNARDLLLHVAQAIRQRVGAGDIGIEQKRSASEPAPDELLERVARDAGLVLTGTAD